MDIQDIFTSKGYFDAYIGISRDDYYNLELFKINEHIKSKKDIIFFDGIIPNPNDLALINSLKEEFKSMNPDNLAKEDISICENEILNSKVMKSMDILILEIDREFNNYNIKISFIIKLIIWSSIYLENIQPDNSLDLKCVFYGDIKKHEAYFLLLLNLIGFQILYINPAGRSNIEVVRTKNMNKFRINEFQVATEYMKFEERVTIGKQIDKTKINKTVTIAVEASKRIGDELLEDAGFIQPWQLQDRNLKSLILSSTVEEIQIYWKEPSKLRPGFKVDVNSVEVPVFFTKISGVHSEISQYHKFIDTLKNNENAYFIEFDGSIDSLSKPFKNEGYSLAYALKGDGTINKKAIRENTHNTISTLSYKHQDILIDKLEATMDSDVFSNRLSKEDKVKGIYTVVNLNEKILELIENFDYSGVNPKVILYINSRIVLNKELVFVLLFLSRVGFDIIILAPCGSANIEDFIKSNLVDIHRLDKVVNNLELTYKRDSRPGFMEMLLGRRRG